MRVAHQPRSSARGKEVHRLIGHDAGGHVQKRHVDVLAFARPPALDDRGQYGGGSIDPGEHIRHRDAHLLRLAICRAGDRHQPGHALDDEVIPRPVRIWAILPEPGDRAVNQPGVHLAQ